MSAFVLGRLYQGGFSFGQFPRNLADPEYTVRGTLKTIQQRVTPMREKLVKEEIFAGGDLAVQTYCFVDEENNESFDLELMVARPEEIYILHCLHQSTNLEGFEIKSIEEDGKWQVKVCKDGERIIPDLSNVPDVTDYNNARELFKYMAKLRYDIIPQRTPEF